MTCEVTLESENYMNFTTHRAYPWFVLAAGTMAVFSALGLARFGYSVLLPSMQAGLNLDNSQAGVLASANLVGYHQRGNAQAHRQIQRPQVVGNAAGGRGAPTV